MKVFEFDPKTGHRGKLLREVRVASWTDYSIEYAVQNSVVNPIVVIRPKPRKDERYTIHIDAGITDSSNNSISYRHPDKWVMFCLGKYRVGTDEWWEWVILPPTSELYFINGDHSV